MNIAALGILRPHDKIPEWLVSELLPVPYFDNRKLGFTLDGLEPSDEAEVEKAVVAFLALGPIDRASAAQYVFARYRHIAELVDNDDLACRIESADDVWGHVQPSEIFVSKRSRREQAIYVQITAECDWEPEHGLQLVYRRGNELSRVSEQDGHLTHTDAYNLPEIEDRIVVGPRSLSKSSDPKKKPWWKLR